MYCDECGQQIPDQVYVVRYVSDDPYQIAIETNDVGVTYDCRQIHSECKYQLGINEEQIYISEYPSMHCFLTYKMSDLPILKALSMSLGKMLNNRRTFDQRLENSLILKGYQKLPGEDTVYIKKK